jgi:selenocysteine lyase/cysteine desulfurase
MKHLKVAATACASFSAYNTRTEVDLLVEGVVAAQQVFA